MARRRAGPSAYPRLPLYSKCGLLSGSGSGPLQWTFSSVVLHKQTPVWPWPLGSQSNETRDGPTAQHTECHYGYRRLPRIIHNENSIPATDWYREHDERYRPPNHASPRALGHTALQYTHVIFNLIQSVLVVGQQAWQIWGVIGDHYVPRSISASPAFNVCRRSNCVRSDTLLVSLAALVWLGGQFPDLCLIWAVSVVKPPNQGAEEPCGRPRRPRRESLRRTEDEG